MRRNIAPNRPQGRAAGMALSATTASARGGESEVREFGISKMELRLRALRSAEQGMKVARHKKTEEVARNVSAKPRPLWIKSPSTRISWIIAQQGWVDMSTTKTAPAATNPTIAVRSTLRAAPRKIDQIERSKQDEERGKDELAQRLQYENQAEQRAEAEGPVPKALSR